MNELTMPQPSNPSVRPGPVLHAGARRTPAAEPLQDAQRDPIALNPIAAATAPDPYPHYEALVAARPLYYDARLELWVASSAQVVRQILADEAFRVRPVGLPVPPALKGSRAGEIFARLVRMNDGAKQKPLKEAVRSALAPVSTTQLLSQSMAWTEHLLHVRELEETDQSLPDITLRLPVYALGSLLGVPSDQLPRAVLLLDDFARCIAPGADERQIARAKAAAEALWDLFQELLQQAQFPSHCNPLGRPTDRGLLSAFARAACRHAGHDEGLIIANAIGFLFQSYEATAGLIGNGLLALARHPELAAQARQDPARLDAILREVLRHDPPIQNTRRFLAEDVSLHGADLKAGDAVLLLLAAANRDPEVNAASGAFDPARKDPALFTFSAGAHRCPGSEMAIAMARGAVQQVLASEIDLSALTRDLRYRPSQNARVPLLNWQTT